MIEALVFLRYILLFLMPIAIILAIYFGMKSIKNKGYKSHAISSVVAFCMLPFFITFYNQFLAITILNDIEKQVNLAHENDYRAHLDYRIQEIETAQLMDMMSSIKTFRSGPARTSDEVFEVVLEFPDGDYSFLVVKGRYSHNSYWLYTNEYNYELELAEVRTDMFDE